VKVLLTIEGGFAKTIFEGDKGAVEWFLKGFQYARKMNLESPEVIGVLNELIRLTESDNYVYWSAGALAAIQNSKGKLEVVE
jgi:hypothetical protein